MRKENRTRGLTLTEVVIASAIIAVVTTAAMKYFTRIGTTIYQSRTKQVATTLAREKLEALQRYPYYRLRPWNDATRVTHAQTGIQYDSILGAPEMINVGGVRYFRMLSIQKVKKDPTGPNLIDLLDDIAEGSDLLSTPYYQDTGLKRINVHVAWQSANGWKKIQVVGLKENAVRLQNNCVLWGLVKSTSGALLDQISVEVVESGHTDATVTDASGRFTFNVSPGTYTLRAVDTRTPDWLYFGARKSVAIDNDDSPKQAPDFELNAVDVVSRANATFWFNSAPVISRVCGSSVSFVDPTFDQEWVEIFNPTTWTWNVKDDLSLQYYIQHASFPLAAWSGNLLNSSFAPYYQTISVDHFNNTIPPGGYYLFANTRTINLAGSPTILADAVWKYGVNVPTTSYVWWDFSNNYVFKIFGRFDPYGKLGLPNPDLITTAQVGVPLRNNGFYNGGGGYLRLAYKFYGYDPVTFNWVYRGYLDSVGWFGGRDAGNPDPPMYAWMGHSDANRREREGLLLVDNDIATGLRDPKGLDDGEQWIRIASTASWMEMRDVGPAYDSDNNERDFVKFTTEAAAGPNYLRFAPRNSLWPTYSTHVVSGRYAATTVNPGDGNWHKTPWHRHNFVRTWVEDGISRPDSGWNGGSGTPHWMSTGPWSGQEPPFTNMFCEDFTVTRHQNCRPGRASLSVSRIEDGTWAWGLYARHFPNPFYGYVASTQAILNVTPGSFHGSAAIVPSGLLRGETDVVYSFGEIRDVFSIPHSSIPIRLMAAAVLASTETRVSGAFTLNIANPPTRPSSLDVNNPAAVGYEPALGSAGLNLLTGYPLPPLYKWYDSNTFSYKDSTFTWKNWFNGIGYQIATRLHYVGYIDGHVLDADTNAPVPDVSVSAFSAAAGDERSTALTNGSGYFRLYVSTGMYRVRAVPEFEEVATPEVAPPLSLAPANLASAGSTIYVGTITLSNAFGKRDGRVTRGGQNIETGVLVILTSTTTILASTAAISNLDALFRSGAGRYYMTSSNAVGTYSFDVRKGTYNLFGFYNDETAGISQRQALDQYINSGNNGSNFPDLAW